MSFEVFVGPLLAFALGAKFTMFLNTKSKTAISDLNARVEIIENASEHDGERLAKLEETIEVIDKQTLAKMVSTMQPVATALKEIQAFVGLR
ncbi:MAG: hypothetical protein VXY99_04325 [Pseudomonadota bacterium]|nr:hypothetical protein [Pseudomonadota bacterium]